MSGKDRKFITNSTFLMKSCAGLIRHAGEMDYM